MADAPGDKDRWDFPWERPRLLPEQRGDPVGFPGVRMGGPDEAIDVTLDRVCPRRPRPGAGPPTILAISGGASGGAFGAGLLVGLSRAGRRDQPQIVTGVSTGALIAPFAFVGQALDDRLEAAYTNGLAADLFDLRRSFPNLEGGLFKAQALDALIAPFVDDALLIAVAEAHDDGRRLLVATTDIDRQELCVWDMGLIARMGQDGKQAEALALFRTLLAASASLPGLFSPRFIACEKDGRLYEEMHVDGGVASPLFLLPDKLIQSREAQRRLRGGQVSVIVNTVLEALPRSTQGNIPAILTRSFETMLRFSYLQALSTTAAYCAGAGLPLIVASIPQSPEGFNLLNFDTALMRRMFKIGLEHAQSDTFSRDLTGSAFDDWLRWPLQLFGAPSSEAGRDKPGTPEQD